MPHGLLHKDVGRPVVCSVDIAQIVADNDIHGIEEMVDDLLNCNLAAADPYSLCMHDYIAVLQPLQLALEYTWALYSRHQAMQGTAVICLTAASAFRSALQRYAKAAQTELQEPSQDSSPSSRRSEQLRRQLRPLKRAHGAARVTLKAEEHHNQQSQILLRSRTAALDWDVVRSVPVPNLEDSQGLQQLCNILHILAYADICQQPWQDLRTSDCLHFIQLAQRGLEYMLRLASTAHSALERSREGLHRQEGAISRLHQRSRDCFRQLKAAQAPPHPTHQPHIPLQERELHAQPSASIAGAHSADVQPMNGMQGVQEEQQGQMDVLAKESEGRQRRCASPLKGSQVRYMASSHTPVLVQGRATDTAPSRQPGAGSHSIDDEQGGAAQDTRGWLDANRTSLLQEPGGMTQDLEASLRHEEQQLHEARSQVAELWAAVAAVGQQPAASAAEAAYAAPSAPQLDWTADMPPATAQQPINHTTSLNVDLEAMRAAERSHAEAQLRSVFADIKQKAFADITQRMNRTGDGRRNSSWLGTASSNDLSGSQSVGATPKHGSHIDSKQLMQRFSSEAPTSQLVKHLQSGSGLQRLSSSIWQAHSSSARPPKGKVFGMQLLSHNSVTSTRVQSKAGKYNTHQMPGTAIQAQTSPSKLMRLTSCVKLTNAAL